MKREKIDIITNVFTMPDNFSKTKPVSYGFFKFGKELNKKNKKLIFVNQDKNWVYYKVYDKNTGNISRIKEMLYEDLKRY